MNSKRRRLHKYLGKIITLSFHRITMSIGVLTKYFKRFSTTTMKYIYFLNNKLLFATVINGYFVNKVLEIKYFLHSEANINQQLRVVR